MNTPEPRFEDLPRYIRVRSKPSACFVEFDFAIGYPDLFVELVLPQAAFTQFCQQNHVLVMDQAMAQAIDDDMIKWRFGEAGSRMPGQHD
jgi:phenol/toluene 2-monooxygenase (NADH) P0/A0